MARATTIPTPKSEEETTIDGGDAATASYLSTLHPDIIQTHILSRLGGSSLASAATTCSPLYALASQEDLWANLCGSTWPSSSSPRVRYIIRRFPHGSRSFFSDSFTIPRPIPTTRRRNLHINLDRTPRLISAVDLYYRGQPILSRVVETETVSDGFRCKPFRVDMLEPKDVVQTPMRYPESGKARWELEEELRLSWKVIDASGRRAVNLWSQNVILVQRGWAIGEVEVLFVWEMEGKKESYEMQVSMTCVGVEGGKMQVTEGKLEMEDMYGKKLKGRESLAILQRALEGKRESMKERRKRHERERKERMLRSEGWFGVVWRWWDFFLWVCYVEFG